MKTGEYCYLLSMLCFGVSNCLWSKPLQNISATLGIVYRASITSVIFVCLYVTALYMPAGMLHKLTKQNAIIHLVDVAAVVALCTINYFGIYFFSKAIKAGSISITAPLLCLDAAIYIVVGVMFLKEIFTLNQTFTLVLFLIGLFFIRGNFKNNFRFTFSKNIQYSLLAVLFWGGTGVLFPYYIRLFSPLLFSLILESVVLVMSIAIYVFETKTIAVKPLATFKNNIHYFLPNAVFTVAGVLFINIAFGIMHLTSIGILGLVQPMVSVIIAAGFLNEKLKPVQYVAILIILVGLVVNSRF